MEVVLIGALIVKYDTILSTFRNLQPFLNIERHSEFPYRMIIVLKCMYVFYAMENAVPKFWMLLFTGLSKACFIYMKTEFAVYAYVTLIFHCVNICLAQMALTGMIAIGCEPFEFLLDVYVLFCSFYYGAQTYKREIHKLVIIICLSAGIGSYINNIESTETFRFGVYYLITAMCMATAIPLLPSHKKYGHRLVFYYVLLTIWVAYKGDVHSNKGLQRGSDVCSINQLIYESQHCSANRTIESLDIDNISNYGKMMKVDLKGKRLAKAMKAVKKSRVNIKEASCKYDLIPDLIRPMEMYSTKQENLETDIKETADGTRNPEMGHIEATEYDIELMSDITVDSTEEGSVTEEIKERTDGTTNQEIELVEAIEYGTESITDMKVDSTEQENSLTEIKETDETTNQERGLTEAIEYDTEPMTDITVDSTEQDNLETEIEERTDGTINQEIGRIEAIEYASESMTNMKVDRTEKENSVTEIKERSDGAPNQERGLNEAIEYETELMTDMKEDSTEQQNLVTKIKEMTDVTTNQEIGRIEAIEYDTDSITDMEEDSTEQKNSVIEINERTDGTIKPEIEGTEVTEKDKASTESYKFTLNFDDEKNLLEENSNLEEDMVTENIQYWTENPSEDEIFLVNLFQMNETNGYEEYMDDPSDTTESFPITETSVDDIDYEIERRLGNVERIDNEIRHVSVYKELEFKIPAKSKQNHHNDEFVVGTQPFYDKESDGKSTLAKIEIEQTKLQATETYVVNEKGAAKKAVPDQTLIGEPKVEEPESGLLELAEARVSGEIGFHSTPDSKNEENYLQRENGTTAASDCGLTPVVEPQNSLMKDTKTRNVEAQEVELVSTTVIEETDAETSEAVLSQVLDNPNEVNEIQNEWAVLKETDESKVDSSEAVQATDFVSLECLTTKSKETCKSQVSFMETKAIKSGEMTEDEDSEPTVSTATKDCERKFALARYPRANDYEICKPVPLINNHEISKDNSKSKFTTFGAQKTKTIYQTPENTDKQTGLKLGENYIDSSERVISSKAPDFYFSNKDGDEVRNSHFSAILSMEKNEYESMMISDKETTSIRTYYQTGENERRDWEENNLLSTSNEADAIKIKPDHNYEAKETESAMFKSTETKETKQHRYDPTEISNMKAEDIKTTSPGSLLKNNLKSSKKNELESININTIKSQVLEIDSLETNKGKGSTAETVLPKTLPSNHESTKEIETINVLGSEQSQFPTKAGETRDTKDNHIRETELGAAKNGVVITKPFQQDIEDSIENEFKFNAVSDSSKKEFEFSNATDFDTRDITPIKLSGPRDNQFKQGKIRHFGESSSGTTRPQTTKIVPHTTEPKQLVEVRDFTASENENKVSHTRIEELEIPKTSDASARESQSMEAVGPRKSSIKSTKARETKIAYEGNKLRGPKTGVPRALERKPTEQGEFRDSFANDPNKVNFQQENGLETTTVSYVETEIEIINVSNLKDSQFKPTTSGDVETCKSEPTISRENIQPPINKAEELEGIEGETTEESNDDFIGVSENLPILAETLESGYPNKASDSKELRFKVKKIDNFSASESISTSSGYIEPRKINDVSEIGVTESKENEVKEAGELGKQNIKVNPSNKIESKGITFKSNGPAVASVPHELKPEEITNNGKVPKFDLSLASEVRPNGNELLNGNSKSIQSYVKIKHPVDNEKNEAYKTEDDDTKGSEESRPEKEIESVEDGASEMAEIQFQKETAKRVFEYHVTVNQKSETSSFSKTELLMSKSEATPVEDSEPIEEEFGKEMVMIDVEKPDKISSKGNVAPSWLGSTDIVATEIHGISATETIPEMPDVYKTAETKQMNLEGETVAVESEVQKIPNEL